MKPSGLKTLIFALQYSIYETEHQEDFLTQRDEY